MQDYIPLEAFFGQGMSRNTEVDPRPVLQAAEVILGVDIMSGHEFLIYGRKLCRELVNSGQNREVNVLRIGVDQETDDLERLVVLVQTAKGSHEYQSWDEYVAMRAFGEE